MSFNEEIKEEFLELTKNADAWEFVRVFCERCHYLDDLIDEPGAAVDGQLIERELEWLLTLSTNPFYLKHSSSILPVIFMGHNAWLDSNAWAKSDSEVKRVHSDVIKSHYHEVVFLVVYLCAGWSGLRAFTKIHREYQIDNYGTLRR